MEKQDENEAAYTSDPEQSFEAEDPIEQDPDLMQPNPGEGGGDDGEAGENEPNIDDILNAPIKIIIPSEEGSGTATDLPLSVPILPADASNEQLQEVLKSKKPTCAGLVATYSCGAHDAAPQYSGPIISVAAGDDIAMNSLILSVVSIDGGGNGEGLIKIPMMNNVKLGVSLSGIKVAEGGCIVAGRAELSGVDASILTAQQREQLAKAYAIFNAAADYGIANAGEIAEDINKTMAAIKSLSDKLNEKKRNTQAILAATDAENLTEALTACTDIDKESRALQDSLASLICKVKAGTLKADQSKLEAAQAANKAFMDKLGPALADCQNTTFTPWEEKPCPPKGPSWDYYTVDKLKCKKDLDYTYGVESEADDEAILAKYIKADEFESDNPCLTEADYYKGLKDGFKASWTDLWELTKSLGNSQTYKDLFYAFKVVSCGFPCPEAEVMLSQIKLIDEIKRKLTENVYVLSCYEEGLATGRVFTDMLAGEGIAAASTKGIRLIGKAANKVKIAKPIESAAQGLMVGKYNWPLVKKYFQFIQEITGRAIEQKQVDALKAALKANEYKKLSAIEYKNLTKSYTKVKREAMIKEWEMNTNQTWPVDENGRKYQLHHIIEQQYGGPHEWWNSHPAKFPDEHQLGIHGVGSPSRELFN